MEPDFLSLEKLLEIHQIQIREFGGSHGVRDIGLLQSATAMPQDQYVIVWFTKLAPDGGQFGASISEIALV